MQVVERWNSRSESQRGANCILKETRLLLDLQALLAETLDLDRDERRSELVVLAQPAETIVQVRVPELDDLAGGGAHHVVVTTAGFQ